LNPLEQLKQEAPKAYDHFPAGQLVSEDAADPVNLPGFAP
jgi:hypothetical protein